MDNNGGWGDDNARDLGDGKVGLNHATSGASKDNNGGWGNDNARDLGDGKVGLNHPASGASMDNNGGWGEGRSGAAISEEAGDRH